jgi:hypothetical protein
MAIKEKALSAYFFNSPAERNVAERLDEAFDITYGQRHGDKSFWLADPKTHTKERFGLNQEVLVIYSPHPVTDARSLTAIENISRNPDFKHRIDKVLFILIHSGDQETAKQIARTDSDRVVVCFNVKEILDPHKGDIFIRTRIADEFGEVDLFGMSSPITSDKYFFGREKLVQELVTRSTINSQNSGLFGLRKTGKTSALRAIERRMENQNILCEYLDCHNPGVHANRWWQVLENVTERLTERLKREYKRSSNVKLDYSESNCGTRFSSDIDIFYLLVICQKLY